MGVLHPANRDQGSADQATPVVEAERQSPGTHRAPPPGRGQAPSVTFIKSKNLSSDEDNREAYRQSRQRGRLRTGHVLFLTVALSAARDRSLRAFTGVCQVMPVLHLMKPSACASKI
jgi:hypothetical protein